VNIIQKHLNNQLPVSTNNQRTTSKSHFLANLSNDRAPAHIDHKLISSMLRADHKHQTNNCWCLQI